MAEKPVPGSDAWWEERKATPCGPWPERYELSEDDREVLSPSGEPGEFRALKEALERADHVESTGVMVKAKDLRALLTHLSTKSASALDRLVEATSGSFMMITFDGNPDADKRRGIITMEWKGEGAGGKAAEFYAALRSALGAA